MKKRISKILAIAIYYSLSIHFATAQTPTTAAPTPPPRSDSKVISIFSDDYSNVSGTNFSPFWNQATKVSTLYIAGNSTLKFTNFNYQGFELGNSINVLSMTHLHVDVWTSNETKLSIAPISQSASNKEIELSPIKLNNWNSYDISLASQKLNWVSLTDVFQFILKGAGGHTIYLDNLYFYNDTPGEDNQGPINFTARAGTTSFNSIEVVMNGSDNSGAVFYELNSSVLSAELSGANDQQKTITIYDLEPEKSYKFTVTARDYAGNSASNNPIELSLTTKATPAPAPTPPARTNANVISIYGDAYPIIDGWHNYFANWKQLSIGSEIKLNNNPTLMYRNFNYQGFELGSDVNALPMTHLHIDVWTPDETALEISPVSRTKTNLNYPLKPLKLFEWNSFDIPLSSIKDKWLSISDIYQFMLKGAGGRTILIDNLYFYNNSGITDTEPPTSFTVINGAITFNSIELLLKASDNLGAVNYQIFDGTNTHYVKGISGVTKPFTIYNLKAGTNYNLTINVKDPTGNQAINTPFKHIAKTYEAQPASEPNALATEVISIFSDKYPNIANSNYNPNWNQATAFAINKLNENEYISLGNFNYQGIELGKHLNLTAMKYLHLDIWTPNETALQVTIISPGKEKLITLSPLILNKWNSFDIPLTSFNGVALNDVFQLKFVGSGGKIVYLDNLFFSKSISTSVVGLPNKEGIWLFPNPVNDQLRISAEFEIKNLIISNIYGQILQKSPVYAESTTLDLSSYSAGHYFITIENNQGELMRRKIIKQ